MIMGFFHISMMFMYTMHCDCGIRIKHVLQFLSKNYCSEIKMNGELNNIVL